MGRKESYNPLNSAVQEFKTLPFNALAISLIRVSMGREGVNLRQEGVRVGISMRLSHVIAM